MSEAEHIAIWVGLIGSVVSVVLAGVAISFTWAVNGRTERLNDQTIKSLQSIESDVELVKETIRDLVKAAWESRVVAGVPAVAVDAPVKEIASGLATEQLERSDTKPGDGTEGDAATTRRYEDLRSSIEAILAESRPTVGIADPTALTLSTIESLSPEAREILTTILRTNRHLTPEQYDQLGQSDLGDALRELRGTQFLVPLRGRQTESGTLLVYNVPKSRKQLIRPLLELLPRPDRTVRKRVGDLLEGAGYRRPHDPGSAR